MAHLAQEGDDKEGEGKLPGAVLADARLLLDVEFRKVVMITLYARQQKRHRCIGQSFGLCGRGSGE